MTDKPLKIEWNKDWNLSEVWYIIAGIPIIFRSTDRQEVIDKYVEICREEPNAYDRLKMVGYSFGQLSESHMEIMQRYLFFKTLNGE